MSCKIYVDRHRHVFLQYKEGTRYLHFITMFTGAIRTSRLLPGVKKRLGLKLDKEMSPQHFAEVCLHSTLEKTPKARVILQAIQGNQDIPEDIQEINQVSGRLRFSGDMVTLRELLKKTPWDPQRVRKYLRKAGKRPGTRWEWPKAEAEAIKAYLESLGDILNAA